MGDKIMAVRNDRELFIDTEGLPFRPRPGRGKESLTHIGRKTFLCRVQNIVYSAARSTSNRGLAQGRGAFRFEHKFFNQRVVVKARFVRMKASNKRSLRTHLCYLERSGVGRDGGEPKAFSSIGDLSSKDIDHVVQEWSKDRHHFRFIVSPEMGSELELEQYAKRLISGMEKDLKTKIS